MEGPISFWGYKEQESNLILPEHDDDDDDDDEKGSVRANFKHFYMNLFTGNSPYYHLVKCLLFLLKHPVYVFWIMYVCVCIYTDVLPYLLCLVTKALAFPVPFVFLIL